jgi:hypothetical protein
MADWSSGVSAPGGASYAAPLMNFSNFSNWAADDPSKKIFDQQAQQTNQQRITQGQQAIDLSKAFPQGLPKGPDGQIDYQAAAQIFARFGDPATAVNVMQQAPPPMSPLLGGGGGQPAAAAAPGPVGAAPASVQARPLPPPSGGSPRGDSPGSITDIVTDRLPSQNMTTGQTILKIAEVMGVDPNATLTPGQLRRAQGLLQKYAPEIAGQSGGGAPVPVASAGPAAVPPPAANGAPASFDSRFAAASGGASGDLPPSANAGSPAPPATVAPPAGGGPAQPQPGPAAPMQGAPQAATAGPQAAPQPQGPIVPQVPLPKGFTDPQQAIEALRNEAARLSRYPNSAGQVAQLVNHAQRIEQSIQPLSVGTSTTLIDPRSRDVLYQGPGAAAIAAASAGGSPTLDADAEVYRQTGKLPPNMGRGAQGAAESKALRARALEQEVAAGGDPGEWSSRWQKFQAQATGMRKLEGRAVGLTLAENEASSLIPRVREASARVSRTEYPDINKLINAAKKKTGGTDVIKLGIAIESLIPVYARVLKPVGDIGVADTARAHELLDKSWADGQINAAMDQMEVELKSARGALNKTMREYGVKALKEQDGTGAGSSATSKVSPSGVNWSIEK